MSETNLNISDKAIAIVQYARRQSVLSNSFKAYRMAVEQNLCRKISRA
ncbi:hypothetical protein [Desulfosporosinus fructosivorans]